MSDLRLHIDDDSSIHEQFILTKEEAQTLWKFMMHEHIDVNLPKMQDIVHKLRHFLEKYE